MTETLKWGDNTFVAGDRLTSVFDHRLITITDIFPSSDGFGGISVALEIGELIKRTMSSEEFAYRVDRGHMTRIVGPIFELGRKFIHNANNDTVEVISISERPDWKGEYKYFVSIVNEIGNPSFTTVDETYLTRCLKFVSQSDTLFVLPEIEVGAVFPDTALV